jgi:hypothetical protein
MTGVLRPAESRVNLLLIPASRDEATPRREERAPAPGSAGRPARTFGPVPPETPWSARPARMAWPKERGRLGQPNRRGSRASPVKTPHNKAALHSGIIPTHPQPKPRRAASQRARRRRNGPGGPTARDHSEPTGATRLDQRAARSESSPRQGAGVVPD